MSFTFFKAAALSTALLMSTASVAAYAAEVSVGGVTASVVRRWERRGRSAPASASAVPVEHPAPVAVEGGGGGVAATANVGGGGGNIASGHVGAAGSDADFAIGFGNGPLAKVDSNGNPVSGGNHSNAAVNLGSLLDGIDVGGIGGGGGGGGLGGGGGGRRCGRWRCGWRRDAPGLHAIASGLSAGDQAVLKLRCRNVLASPERLQSRRRPVLQDDRQAVTPN